MKTWRYYHLYLYEKKGEWFFDFMNETHKSHLLTEAFNYLGKRGWECIGSSSFIGSEFTNIGFIPFYADNIRTETRTDTQIFTFKQEVETADSGSNCFENFIENKDASDDGKIYTVNDIINATSDELKSNINNLLIAIDYYMHQYQYKRIKKIGNRIIYSTTFSPIDCEVSINKNKNSVTVRQGDRTYDFYDDWDSKSWL